MKIKTIINDAIDVSKMNKAKMDKVANSKKSFEYGIYILLAPFVVNVVLAALNGMTFFNLQIKMFLLPLLTIVGMIFLMSLAAELIFKKKGDHKVFFRVLAYASIFSWLSVVPVFLSLIGLGEFFNLFNDVYLVTYLFVLVAAYHMLMSHYHLSKDNTIIVVVAGFVVFFLLQGILGNLLIGRFYSLGLMYF
jgi:hypothetical protein